MQGKFSFTFNRSKVFWGILFLLGAALFLVGKLGFFEGIGFWSILFSIWLVSVLISSLIKGSWGGILFSLAFLVIVNDEFLGLEAITPWPVLGAATLGTIGLNLLFPKFRRKKSYKLIAGGEHRTGDTVTGDKVYFGNAFGSAVKYVAGEVSQIRLDNAFGSLEVYFSNAVLKDHVANVKIDSAFGKVVLYVPKDWHVVNNNMEAAFGSVDLDYESNPGAENTLYLSGEVSFGVLLVTSV